MCKEIQLGDSKWNQCIPNDLKINRYIEVSFGSGMCYSKQELTKLKLEVLRNQYAWESKSYIEEKSFKKYSDLTFYEWSQLINYYYYGRYHYVYEDPDGIDFNELITERSMMLKKSTHVYKLPNDKLTIPTIGLIKKHEEKKDLKEYFTFGKSKIIYGGMNRMILDANDYKTLVVINLPSVTSDVFHGDTIFGDGEFFYLNEIINRVSDKCMYILVTSPTMIKYCHLENGTKYIKFNGEMQIERLLISNILLVFDD